MNVVELARSYNINNQVMKSAVEFVNFLRDNKYNISPASSINFIEMINIMEVLNPTEYKEISRCVFCSNKFEDDCFDELYQKFFYNFDEKLHDDIQNQTKENKEEIEKLEKMLSATLGKKASSFKRKFEKILETELKTKSDAIRVHKKDSQKISDKGKKDIEDLLETLGLPKKTASAIQATIIPDEKALAQALIRETVDFDCVAKSMQELMISNLETKANIDFSNLILKSIDSFSEAEELSIPVKEQMLSELKEEQDSCSQEFTNKIAKKQEEISKLKIKEKSIKHRQNFTGGKNSVIELMKNNDRQVTSLSGSEYESLLYYIRLNSSKFRTKISRSMRKHKNAVIDIKKTSEEGMKFGGVPMKLYFKKPVVKKYKLVCVLDISGSVSKYLEVLASFIHEISSVFNGGIKVYGFVNSLLDFSDVFKNETISSAVKTVKGYRGYSSYGTAIQDFYNMSFKSIDSNTIILYFGDARNNKNISNQHLLKAINDRAKFSVWLNPEDKSDWNKADSIIDIYGQLTNQVYEVNKVNQLIGFLNDFSID